VDARNVRHEVPMPTLLDRHRQVMPSWISLYYQDPISLVRGEGRRVWDADERCYLDFFGGILTTMVGHAVPEVVEAIREQAGRMLHTSTLYLIEPQVELAEEIAGLSGIPDAKVFFTSSGTEANDAALLLATSYRRSNQVLALRNSYHGRSFTALSVTGNRSWSPSSLSPLNVSYVQGGYKLRSPLCEMSDAEYTDFCVWDLQNVLDTMTSGDVACMIAEPIQGVGGFVTPPDGFFAPMKDVLDAQGILFVSDEVQTGWGRTGEHFWGYQAHGVVPDILTFAKGIGNGLAIAGVVARREIMDCLSANSISTFGGNPLATTGALATLRYLRENDLQGNTLAMGKRLRGRLDFLAARHEGIAEVRGKGLMQGIELVRPGGLAPDPGATAAVLEETRERGLLIGKGGLEGNVVRLAPPLSLTAEETDEGAEILEKALDSVFGSA
jgi:4-aminobutyrate aminotransferase